MRFGLCPERTCFKLEKYGRKAMKPDMNLLGIDVGTTSVKAALFDEMGNMIQSETYDYTLIAEGDRVEFPAEDYVTIVKQAINDIRKNHEIFALAIDTQCETLIVADENGNPLRNAIVWLDNRASTEAEEIKTEFGLKHVYEITGQPEITATWPAAKLLWMRKNEPEIFRKTKKIFLLEDWLIYKLTGEFVTEKTLQSSSLYFDITTGKWWDEMLRFIGVDPSLMPRLADSCELVGEFEGIKVVTSAMDQIAAAVGAGVCREGLVSEMTGTAMVIFAPCKDIPTYNENSIIPCHYNFDGSYAQLLWTSTAGMTLKWFKNALCENFSFRELDELAKEVPIGCGGLTMLPHLSGSTMPKYNPDARGCFCGMTLEHTRGHFIRSILEAVACMLRANLEYLPFETDEIRIMGGGASSPLWCQIKADMTGKKLKTLKCAETATLGSAVMAGVGAGVFTSVSEACDKIVATNKEYLPCGDDYSEVYDRYIKLDNLLN